MSISTNASFEYIVVGSGAGGGTVAARLAEAGPQGSGAGSRRRSSRAPGRRHRLSRRKSSSRRLPRAGVSRLLDRERGDALGLLRPALRGRGAAKERPEICDWYPKKNDKRKPEFVDGVLYPRAGCLGGCTAHNAMIMVYPHNEDWDQLAQLTGDPSWGADNMRRYFEKLENCHHRPFFRLLAKLGINPTAAWLERLASHSEKHSEGRARGFRSGGRAAGIGWSKAVGETSWLLKRAIWFFLGKGDPNDWRLVRENAFGLHYPPLTTRQHARMGTRERLLETQEKYPANLTIELDALVTRVLFDDDNRAIGVEYRKGARLYKAHENPSSEPGETRQVFASNEVILAGGAFNTPQLLMLSGVGPKEELEKHRIAVRIDLPGVGTNLQDRYEVGVVNRVRDDWGILKGAKYKSTDPQYADWLRTKNELEGSVYGTNGAVLAAIRRSAPQRPVPDLFCFAVLADFRGYEPGYSVRVVQKLNYLTWAVLKAHTNNRAGVVTTEIGRSA